MVKSEPKIESGRAFLELLDKKQVNPSAFFWFYLPDSNTWRLVISAAVYSGKDIKDAYKSFIEQFSAEEIVKEITMHEKSIYFTVKKLDFKGSIKRK